MSGTTLTVRGIEGSEVSKLAGRAAREARFRVTRHSDLEFSAEQGSFGLSVLLGPLSPYVKFRLDAEAFQDGSTDLMINRTSTAVFVGIVGMSSIKSRTETLVQAIIKELETVGATVKRRDD